MTYFISPDNILLLRGKTNLPKSVGKHFGRIYSIGKLNKYI